MTPQRRLYMKSVFKRKIALKYSAFLAFLLIYLLLFISLFISIFKNGSQFFDKLLMAIFYIFAIEFILLILYSKKSKLPEITSETQINEYLEFFSNSDIRNYIYVEAITWFYKVVRSAYLQKTDYISSNDYIDLINILYHILRPNRKGLCLAALHQEKFTEISKLILNNGLQNNKSGIFKMIEEMQADNKKKQYHPSLGQSPHLLYSGMLL